MTNTYYPLPLINYSSGSFETSPLQQVYQKPERITEKPAETVLPNSQLVNNMERSSLTENPLNWITSSSATYQSYDRHFFATPPPEGNGYTPPYPYATWQRYGSSSDCQDVTSSMSIPTTTNAQSFMCGDFLQGSSLEESPISSPSSSVSSIAVEQHIADEISYMKNRIPPPNDSSLCNQMYDIGKRAPASAMVPTGYDYNNAMTSCYSQGFIQMSPEPLNVGATVPKGVKLPQRKGGIQLWQFLYALLTDPAKKHRDIIEWTCNIHEREFRMLEPETIAIWWGHHKNKPHMSYDKFSRSLRYYYDKGILKKISGERYVYKFLIDPEHMYRHIGTSESRPSIKPMPQKAREAISKHQREQSINFKADIVPIITPEPETLKQTIKTEVSKIQTTDNIRVQPQALPNNVMLQVRSGISNMPNSASTGNILQLTALHNESYSLPMKRCRSFEYADSSGRINGTKLQRFSHSSSLMNNSRPDLVNSFSYDVKVHNNIIATEGSTKEKMYSLNHSKIDIQKSHDPFPWTNIP